MYATTATYPTATEVEVAAAYANTATGECMRKAVVWTNPGTGAQARRYRAADHLWAAQGTSSAEVLEVCVYCGTIG